MKKKNIIICAGLGILFLVLLAFLPNLLSSDRALRLILEQINGSGGTHLQIGDCTIGWSQGLVCADVDYLDNGRGLHVRARQVSGSQGLLALLVASENLGSIHVQDPVVIFGHKFSEKNSLSATEEREKKQQESAAAKDGAIPFWDGLIVSVSFDGGRLQREEGSAVAVMPVGVFSGTASMASGTVQYGLKWFAKTGKGKLAAQGFVNLPARRLNFMDTLVARMRLQVSSFQFGPWLSLAVRATGVPQGMGEIDGDFTINGAGSTNLDIVGHLTGKDLQFSGGILGPDHPKVDRIALSLDGSLKEREGLQLTQFVLESDLGRMTASGSYGSEDGEVRITGLLRLPLLFSRLPHVLMLSDSLVLDKGSVQFSSVLKREGNQQNLAVDAVFAGIEGRYRTRLFSWGKLVPLSIQARLATLDRGEGHRLDLEVESPGSLQSTEVEDKVTTSRFRLHGRFFLPSDGQQSFRVKGWQLDGAAESGSFTLTVGDSPGQKMTGPGGYSCTIRLDLNRLNKPLEDLQILSPETTMSGDMHLTAAGFLAENQLVLREFDLRVQQLELNQGRSESRIQNLIVQPRRSLAADGAPVALRGLLVVKNIKDLQSQGFGLTSFDWNRGQLVLRDMRIHSDVGKKNVDELVVGNVQDVLQLLQSLSRSGAEKNRPGDRN